MLSAKSRHCAGTVGLLVVATSFCVLSMTQAARPLCCAHFSRTASLGAQQLRLTRHALQEVSPRATQPRAPQATRLLHVVVAAQRHALARTTTFVPLWPIDNWPAHRRVPAPSSDTPDPA